VPHRKLDLLLRARLAEGCLSKQNRHYTGLEVLGTSSAAVAITISTESTKFVVTVGSFAKTASAEVEVAASEVLLQP